MRESCPARTLIVAAHPDDEIVGVGGHLAWLGKNVTIVHVTDGVPPWGEKGLARVREQEARAALALAGIPFDALVRLHFEDQRTWPYLTAIADRLRDVIALHEPELVLSAPFEGGHPDHDGVAWATATAIADTRVAHWEWASYNATPKGTLRTGEFLPGGASPIERIDLPSETAALKRAMLACHASQSETLELFQTTHESFRPAPTYDFTQRPAQTLFYETRPWNLTFPDFRAALPPKRT